MAHCSSPRTSHANKCTDLRTCSFLFVEGSDTAFPLRPLSLLYHANLPYLLLDLSRHENPDSNFLVLAEPWRHMQLFSWAVMSSNRKNLRG